MKQVIAILFFLLAAGLIIFYTLSHLRAKPAATSNITNFDQCAAAGYPVMQSYPEECTLPNGQFFVQQTVPGK